MERLCALPLAEREAVWLRLVPRLKAELEGGVREARRAEWAALSDGFATTTEKLCAGGAGDAAAAALLGAARDTARCEPLLKWLRLATGAYMRLQPETYEAIAVAMGDHASLDGWCAAEVETMGIEADEPQVCTTSAQFGANSAQFRAIL